MRVFKKMSKRKYKRFLRFLGEPYAHKRYECVHRGTLLRDCDGFNHRVVDIAGIKWKGDTKGSWFVTDVRATREDGHSFCSCYLFPRAPVTPEVITLAIREYATDATVKHFQEGGWHVGALIRIRDRLKNGLPVCTSDGLPIEAE